PPIKVDNGEWRIHDDFKVRYDDRQFPYDNKIKNCVPEPICGLLPEFQPDCNICKYECNDESDPRGGRRKIADQEQFRDSHSSINPFGPFIRIMLKEIACRCEHIASSIADKWEDFVKFRHK